jgi:GST-like protein
MLKFYFNGSPNPTKVALFLEEAGIAYEPIPIDTRTGDQFRADFLSVNPDGKVPAIVDGEVVVFDSNAILLYLAEKTGRFLPPNNPVNRARLLSWLMFAATGVGPFCGQAVHFKHFAPENQLAKSRYVLGDVYTIVDMDVWGWARMVPFILGDDAWAKFPNLKRLHDEIAARPAAALKDKFTFKTVMDDEARGFMFKHLARAAA